MRRLLCGIIPVLVLLAASAGYGEDWPGFRGAGRDGKSTETGLLKSWPKGGPKLLWSVKGLGKGCLFAYDQAGKRLWRRPYGPEYTGRFPGTRCTPTIDGARVYVTSGEGVAACLSAADGKVLWRHPWRNRHGNHPDTPLYKDGIIYATCGYGKGSVTLKFSADGKTVKKLWEAKKLDPTHGGVALVDGHLYGSGHRGKWFSVNAASGEVTYTATGVGKGSVI